MRRFRRECLLAASPAALFEFHSRTENLRLVMPPTSRVVEVEAEPHAREGGLIRLKVREMGLIRMTWKCRWKTVQPPHLLVDEMVEGPFRVFEHHHGFEPAGPGQSTLVDEVHYQYGRGWAGAMAGATCIRIYLGLMFAWRHRCMKALVRVGRIQSPAP